MRSLHLLVPLAVVACVEPTLTKTDEAPVVVIRQPTDGAVFDEGQAIALVGRVADDGSMEAIEASWIDNGVDVLAEGLVPDDDGNVTFSTATLAPGDHAITLRAVDGSNLSGEASVALEVVEVADEPSITIVSPEPGDRGEEGLSFPFEATVSDPQDAPEDLLLEVSSDLDGFLCQAIPDSVGNALCSGTPVTDGDHRITFTVIDSDSNERSRPVILPVDAISDEPTVELLAPEPAEVVRADTPYVFEATISDRQDPVTLLTATVSSDIDGALCELLIDSQGRGSCSAALTTVGTQRITVTAVDTESYEGTASALVRVSDGTDLDDDGDGYCEVGPCVGGAVPGDCDDTNGSVNPGATETPNGIDDDCNGPADDGTAWFDDDGDGYCERLTGPCTDGALNGDCLDNNALVNPGATETCASGFDDDCSGQQDTIGAAGCDPWFLDNDRDGFGAEGTERCQCGAMGNHDVQNDEDCDDTLFGVNPGATETANGIDDNCNGPADEGTAWFDDDGDGYCEGPTCTDGTTPGDCADGNPNRNPGVPEQCFSGVDDNCNGPQDEAGALGCTPYWIDSDGDGYGNPNATACACTVPSNGALNSLDCDDAVFTVNPSASEAADGIDNNCNGILDEGTVRYDDDGDGYCEAASCTAQPGEAAPLGGDCDDNADTTYPGAPEICGNGRDDNCANGQDEGVNTVGCDPWYQDLDGDGFGGASQCRCAASGSYQLSQGGDCYDGNANAYPGSPGWHDSDRGDGSYDWDCSGTVSRRWTDDHDCGCPQASIDPDPLVRGWDGEPACGQNGTWVTGCAYTTIQVPNPLWPVFSPEFFVECLIDEPSTSITRRQQCK